MLAQLKTVILIKEAINLAFLRRVEYQIKVYLSRAPNTTDLTVKCLLTGSNQQCKKGIR